MTTQDVASTTSGALATVGVQDLMAAFADFMRLDVAEGDASAATIRTFVNLAKK